MNTVVFGISPDETKRLTKFCQRDDHSVADAFGVWGLKKFTPEYFS